MKPHTRLIIIGLAALAFLPCITSCKKVEKQAGKQNAAGEFSPVTLGLPDGVESVGPDPMGRHWYRTSDPAAPQWAYDPKTKTLYSATKDEKSGEWVLKEKLEVTAASLGLASDTVELGKDPNGVYWFEIPKSEKGLAYNTKNKTLYNTQKDSAGKWELGSAVKKP